MERDFWDRSCCEIGECTHNEGLPNSHRNFNITKEEIKAYLVSIRSNKKKQPVCGGGMTPNQQKVWANQLRQWRNHE